MRECSFSTGAGAPMFPDMQCAEGGFAHSSNHGASDLSGNTIFRSRASQLLISYAV
jgi:hypothetical protein